MFVSACQYVFCKSTTDKKMLFMASNAMTRIQTISSFSVWKPGAAPSLLAIHFCMCSNTCLFINVCRRLILCFFLGPKAYLPNPQKVTKVSQIFQSRKSPFQTSTGPTATAFLQRRCPTSKGGASLTMSSRLEG